MPGQACCDGETTAEGEHPSSRSRRHRRPLKYLIGGGRPGPCLVRLAKRVPETRSRPRRGCQARGPGLGQGKTNVPRGGSLVRPVGRPLGNGQGARRAGARRADDGVYTSPELPSLGHSRGRLPGAGLYVMLHAPRENGHVLRSGLGCKISGGCQTGPKEGSLESRAVLGRKCSRGCDDGGDCAGLHQVTERTEVLDPASAFVCQAVRAREAISEI